jgi:hypothetical protein
MTKPQLVLWSAKDLNRKLRCSVHRTLKLGFTKDTAADLKIKEGMSILLYTDGNPAKENVLYMRLLPAKTEESFRVNKAGNYYYGATQNFFNILSEQLNLKFDEGGISYDMVSVVFDNETFYKLTPHIGGGVNEEEEPD